MLAANRFGAPGAAPPLVIVHGLFGAGRNWSGIAKHLSDRGEVITPDLRNHGASPHDPAHDYPTLAADLAPVAQEVGPPVDLCGHSMGGKAAMALALTQPDLIRRLVVADIAPVPYGHSQQEVIDAARAVDLSTVARRSQAAAALAAQGLSRELQAFLSQSIDIPNQRWQLNWDALSANMPAIIGWPDDLTGTFTGPTLFLSGGASDYVQPSHRERIKTLFPAARFAKIPGAGHWLHAEEPAKFEAILRAFLDAD